MSEAFQRVKRFVLDLDLQIVKENPADEVLIVEDEASGIKNLIIDCESPILVLEQLIMKVPQRENGFYRRLLQINRTLVHGAFVLDEAGEHVLVRDTLQLENLDANEFEGTISALSLALIENMDELIHYSHQ